MHAKTSKNVGIERDSTFTKVFLPGLTLFFSFETCIGFFKKGQYVVCQNVWNVVTGAHLNKIDGGKAEAKKHRLPLEEFTKALDNILAD